MEELKKFLQNSKEKVVSSEQTAVTSSEVKLLLGTPTTSRSASVYFASRCKIPDKILKRLAAEPAVNRFSSVDGPVERGNVIEVCAPDGEILLFAVLDSVKAENEGTFAFVRAVSLTDFIEPAPDMPVVYCSTNNVLFTAHCWLEGPVLADAIVRTIGSLGPDSLAAVDAALRATATTPLKHAALRQSLYEQVNPVYSATWEKLYKTVF